MPTIIDALVVEFGLDPSKARKGAQESDDIMKKASDSAKKRAEEIEKSGRDAADVYRRLRGEVLALFAVFTAGRGLKEFIQDQVQLGIETGRTSRFLDTTVGVLSAWRNMAVIAGGSAAGMASSMQGLVREFQNFSITGESSVIPYFRALGINIADTAGRMRPINDIMLDLSDKLSKLDPARAEAFGRALGFDDETIGVLIEGRKALEDRLARQKELGNVTEDDTQAAKALRQAWGEMEQSSSSLGRTLLTTLAPALEKVLGWLTGLAVWARQHMPVVEAAFVALAGVAGALSLALVGALGSAAIGTLVGGIVTLQGGLSGLMLGLGVLTETFLPALSEAFVALGAAIELTPVGWIITGIAALSVAAYELWKHWGDVGALWKQVWGAIGDAVASVGGKIKALWDLLFGSHSGGAPAGGGRGAGASGGPSGSPAYAPPTGSQAEADIARLTSLGWTRPQATGIVANLQRESGLRANALGDNGKAYGLAQWHPDRQAAFARWAGHDIRQSSRDEQLAFLNFELRRGSERHAGAALAGASDAATAAAIISRLYERPANAAGESATRAAIAAALARAPSSALALHAQAGAALGATSTNRVSNSSSETHIGQITVQTQATDAQGIARDIGPAVQRNTFATQANNGPA